MLPDSPEDDTNTLPAKAPHLYEDYFITLFAKASDDVFLPRLVGIRERREMEKSLFEYSDSNFLC